MKKFIYGGVVAAMTVTSPMALAGPSDGAGCGLGGMVLQGKTGTGWGILAWFLNGIGGNQTFAMTSGTSGCDTSTVVQRDELREIFVEHTYDSISQEVAQGNGSHIEVLAALSGVSDADVAEFGALLQTHYGTLFATEADARDMLAALDVVLQEAVL